jgi:hypothetical protein
MQAEMPASFFWGQGINLVLDFFASAEERVKPIDKRIGICYKDM